MNPQTKVALLGVALGVATCITLLGLWAWFVFGLKK